MKKRDQKSQNEKDTRTIRCSRRLTGFIVENAFFSEVLLVFKRAIKLSALLNVALGQENSSNRKEIRNKSFVEMTKNK